MAIRLKAWKTYTDPFWNTWSSYWWVVNQNNGNKLIKQQNYDLSIWINEQTRLDYKNGTNTNVKPVYSTNFVASDTDFDNHFSAAAISADDNHYKQAYLHLLSIPELDQNWDPTWNLVWGDDWETDEVV